LLGPLGRAAGLLSTSEFNLGDKDDFRVPDRGLHRAGISGIWCPTAALVLEILSAGDETPEKIPFYAAHNVDEFVIVDPRRRTVQWFTLEHGKYRPSAGSDLIPLSAAELADRIDWPPVESGE
jgi:hypothetical protein